MLIVERYGQRTMKMVKVQHFPSVFHYTKNNNNNIKILDISFIFMREQIVFFISLVIILILSLTLIIQAAYYYRKIIKDARSLNILKRFNKLKI
jgi:hypothetical protein